MKTELLVQMDGCNPSALQCQLLLVGATNRPEVQALPGSLQLCSRTTACNAEHWLCHLSRHCLTDPVTLFAGCRSWMRLQGGGCPSSCTSPFPVRQPGALLLLCKMHACLFVHKASSLRRSPEQTPLRQMSKASWGSREAMLARHLGEERGIACALSPADLAKVVAKTAGYSGSDMRALIQEACQVRCCAAGCVFGACSCCLERAACSTGALTMLC